MWGKKNLKRSMMQWQKTLSQETWVTNWKSQCQAYIVMSQKGPRGTERNAGFSHGHCSWFSSICQIKLLNIPHILNERHRKINLNWPKHSLCSQAHVVSEKAMLAAGRENIVVIIDHAWYNTDIPGKMCPFGEYWYESYWDVLLRVIQRNRTYWINIFCFKWINFWMHELNEFIV